MIKRYDMMWGTENGKAFCTHQEFPNGLWVLYEDVERESCEVSRLKSQLDEFVYAEDNPTYESEAERLQKIIIKAYQHLGFTGQKNNTMRILGTGLPNRKDSEQKWRVSEEQTGCPDCGGPKKHSGNPPGCGE